MTRQQYQRWRQYQDALLAVYWLAEPDGVRCYASIAELASQARMKPGTARRQVERLKADDVVMRTLYPDKGGRRALALLDHPEAFDYLRTNADYWGPLSYQVVLNRRRAADRAEGVQTSFGSDGVLESQDD